jgi:hypothetical protein
MEESAYRHHRHRHGHRHSFDHNNRFKYNFIWADSQLYLPHRWHFWTRVLLQCRDKRDEVSLYETGFGPKTNFFRSSRILPPIKLKSLGSSGRRRRVRESVFKTVRAEHDSSLDRRSSLWEVSGRGSHLLRRYQQFWRSIIIERLPFR